MDLSAPLRIHQPGRAGRKKESKRDGDMALEDNAVKSCFVFKESPGGVSILAPGCSPHPTPTPPPPPGYISNPQPSLSPDLRAFLPTPLLEASGGSLLAGTSAASNNPHTSCPLGII